MIVTVEAGYRVIWESYLCSVDLPGQSEHGMEITVKFNKIDEDPIASCY